MNGQREDKSLGLFLVIKRQGKRAFSFPLCFGNPTSKPEKKNSEGEERKKGKRREEKGKKKEESIGLFILRYLVMFVWFLLVILMVK